MIRQTSRAEGLASLARRLLAIRQDVQDLREEIDAIGPNPPRMDGTPAYPLAQDSPVERCVLKRERADRRLRAALDEQCRMTFLLRLNLRGEGEPLRRFAEEYVVSGRSLRACAENCGKSIAQCYRYKRRLGL